MQLAKNSRMRACLAAGCPRESIRRTRSARSRFIARAAILPDRPSDRYPSEVTLRRLYCSKADFASRSKSQCRPSLLRYNVEDH